ncbi:MAG: nicotinate-nucleotide adenylyltransferase [Lachnospiraceae bacterium]|nr:nicotinate-nucleotide adenylyltransferase [Lachnospiraceae bacterium]
MDATYKKIGIFGGTFDPIHTGHLMLAEAACCSFGLDKVLFMPTPSPYHRTDKKVQDLEHRINMVKLAIEGNDHFEFSDFEIALPGPTYTYNTLKAFKKEYPDCEIYLIIGGDSLFSIEQWYKFKGIMKMAILLSSKREDETKGASGSLGTSADGSENADYSDSEDPLHDEFLSRVEELKSRYGARIYDIGMPNIEISSSGISRRIREGKTVRYYVPDKVLEYIEENGLYRG